MGKGNAKRKSNKKLNKKEELKEKLNRNDKQKESKNKGKKKKKHKILKRVILTMFLLGLVAFLVLAGIIAGIFFSDKFKLTEEDLKITNMNGIILDKNGEQIGILSGDEKRKIVTFEDMPEYLPKAFIAIEDKRFYDHSGVDIKRTTYATIMYIINRGDSDAGGGSTITQQLVKNLMNDMANEGSAGVERKIREMARAYNVEKILSKDQILELYLNKIFMGSTVYGVGMASEYYFSKPVAELDLAECAFIAGINHTPNSYDPFNEDDDNSEIIKKRTKEVLFQMKDQGYITSEEEYNLAVEKVENGLPFKEGNIANRTSYSYHTAAAISAAIKDIAKEKDVSEDTAEFMIYNNGYTIYTTQDTTIQDRMEEEFLKDKYIRSGKKKNKDGTLLNNHTQAAMVIIDHKTGQVVATVGGLGADSNSTGLNRATQGTKQVGSSIKPIACIAPALENKIITAGTAYDDSKTRFGGYNPHNADNYAGLITIRTALAKSSNVVHVKIMKELGPENSIKFMEKMGLTIDADHAAPSLALGTPNLSPLDMAAAYATIANNGEYITPIFYTKVEDANGNVIVESKQEKVRAMSEANAYVLQNLLKSPVQSGTAVTCYMSNMDVGAKTGSTDNYVDRWLCGFTPYYTAATWFGFDEKENPVFSNVNHAANIWAAVMKDVHKNLKTQRFTKPSSVVYVKICEDSGRAATEDCSRTISEVFVKGTIPGKCEGHTKLNICKETGKIATDYCKDVEEKIYTKKPDKENTKLWTTDPGEKYDVPEEECDKHTAPEQVEMINVVGKTIKEAKKAIEDLGLKVKVIYDENKDKKEDVVLKQSVKEKEKVDKESTITLTVNKYEEKDDENNKNNNEINNNQTKPENNQEQETNTTDDKTNTQTDKKDNTTKN